MAKKRRIAREKYVARLREMDEEREAYLQKRRTRRQVGKTTRDEHSDMEDEIIIRKGVEEDAGSAHASDDDAAPPLVAAGGSTTTAAAPTTSLSFQERLAQAAKKGEQPMKKRRTEE